MSKTLIYIIGAGRSGTTLLDIILGNNSDSISLGEINRYFLRNGVPPKRKTTSDVGKFWFGYNSKFGSCFQNDFTHMKEVFRRHEYHSNIFKAFNKYAETDYINTLKAQYNILKEHTDKNVLIESSKYPGRAINLSNFLKAEDLLLKFVYLKKDPVSVIESFKKTQIEQPSKGFLNANLYYLLVNIICELTIVLLRKRGHHTTVIKYEDLLEDPQNTLLKIQKDLDLNLNDIIHKINQKSTLTTGFLFDGNRIRLKETLTLRSLEKNKQKDFKYFFTRAFNYLIYR
jgi:hypothetical protein